jgi:hypothetical protein
MGNDRKRPGSESEGERCFRPPLQVTEPARLNLSRWRHGFEPRWDYKEKRIVRVLVSTLVTVQTRAFRPHRSAGQHAEQAGRPFSRPAFVPPATHGEARVLPRQAKDQRTPLRGYRRAPQGLPSEGPFVSDQVPVPAKDRRGGLDEEGGPTLAREQAGCRGQQGSVRAPQVRTTGLPGKNLQLVTKNEDLDLALSALLARWHEAKEAP